MAIASDDVALLVDHEACLVHVHVLATLVFAKQKLNLAVSVPIKDSHNLLKLKCLAIVVVKLGHEASELQELTVVKSLDAVLVDKASLIVQEEALKRDKSTKLINVLATSLVLLEAQRVLNVVEEEGSK